MKTRIDFIADTIGVKLDQVGRDVLVRKSRRAIASLNTRRKYGWKGGRTCGSSSRESNGRQSQ